MSLEVNLSGIQRGGLLGHGVFDGLANGVDTSPVVRWNRHEQAP